MTMATSDDVGKGERASFERVLHMVDGERATAGAWQWSVLALCYLSLALFAVANYGHTFFVAAPMSFQCDVDGSGNWSDGQCVIFKNTNLLCFYSAGLLKNEPKKTRTDRCADGRVRHAVIVR